MLTYYFSIYFVFRTTKISKLLLLTNKNNFFIHEFKTYHSQRRRINMNPKILIAVNIITFVIMIILNSFAGAGAINGTSVGDVSDMYTNIISPAGYAFSIWGLIYLELILFIGFQFYDLINNDAKYIKKTGWWFALTNIANSAWILIWVNNMIGIAAIVILILLYGLTQLVYKLDLEIWDAPLKDMFFVWWPIVVYFGWVLIASVQNITLFLSTLEIGFFEGNTVLAVVLLGIVTLIYMLLIKTRNLREASLVAVWAFVAIYFEQRADYSVVAYSALFYSLILLIVAGIHGAKNFKTSPFMKLKRKEY